MYIYILVYLAFLVYEVLTVSPGSSRGENLIIKIVLLNMLSAVANSPLDT
jgi:hypothetical protein